jgi:hypothetical protein
LPLTCLPPPRLPPLRRNDAYLLRRALRTQLNTHEAHQPRSSSSKEHMPLTPLVTHAALQTRSSSLTTRSAPSTPLAIQRTHTPRRSQLTQDLTTHSSRCARRSPCTPPTDHAARRACRSMRTPHDYFKHTSAPCNGVSAEGHESEIFS